jgi:hypothetical protein
MESKRKLQDENNEPPNKQLKVDNNNNSNIDVLPTFMLQIILEYVVQDTWKTKEVNYIAEVNKAWKNVAYEIYNRFYADMYVWSVSDC